MVIPAQTELAISLYASGPTGPATYHGDAQQINYVLPAYDNGDHLHPNDAGYQAMADAINLALFQRP